MVLVAKLVDAADCDSAECNARVGSSPSLHPFYKEDENMKLLSWIKNLFKPKKEEGDLFFEAAKAMFLRYAKRQQYESVSDVAKRELECIYKDKYFVSEDSDLAKFRMHNVRTRVAILDSILAEDPNCFDCFEVNHE